MVEFSREQKDLLISRLREYPTQLIIVIGPRQTGKTTMVQQALAEFRNHYVSADEPSEAFADSRTALIDDNSPAGSHMALATERNERWLVRQWETARKRLVDSETRFVLAVDEVQKIPNWSEVVKGLWDRDRLDRNPLHVVLMGSAPLLLQKGLSESLAGRFETIRLAHWSYTEMSALADIDLSQYVYFGGYPSAAFKIHDELRWRSYIQESLIKPNIERDILALERVDKPALLRNLFEVAALYSGQILSYTKMLGGLHDAGNTTTLARYLELLGNAGLIAGLSKYSGTELRRRSSSPKPIVLNTALMSVLSGYSFKEARADRTFWGRLVESAVGAHLFNTSLPDTKLYYWREKNAEVDFVLQQGRKLVAFEVKSGTRSGGNAGFLAFQERFGNNTKFVKVSKNGITLAEFLATPAAHWFDEQ